MAIFMVQGTVIGVVGTLIGAALGILAALNVSAAISALEGLIGHKFLNAGTPAGITAGLPVWRHIRCDGASS